MYQVVLARPAQRFYDAADASFQRRLDLAFEQLTTGPSSHPNVKRLQAALAGYYRFRVGDYRLIFSIDHSREVVSIATIKHRSHAYR